LNGGNVNLNAQEIVWLLAINSEKVKSLESFIKKFCEFEIEEGTSVVAWPPYKISKESMIIPKDENEFFHKVYDFCKLVDKLIAHELLQFGTKPVGLNELLPVFRKDGKPFQEIWELLKNKQSLTINPTPQLKEFISDDFITKDEKRYLEERHQRMKSEFLTMTIAIMAVVALIITVVALLFVDATKIDKNMFLNQEFAYYTALAERKMVYSESIIEVRAKAIMWLDKFKNEKNFTEKKNLQNEWHDIDEEIKINNSTTMIYSDLQFSTVLNFDELFREISVNLINNTLPDSVYITKRKELDNRFNHLIESIRENTLGDSAYINSVSNQWSGTESKAEIQ
jgi:hypothetical protein